MDNKKQEEEEDKEDKFKGVFKYYKRRQPPPDLSHAVDVDSSSAEVVVQRLPPATEQDKVAAQEAGLTPPHTWTVHTLVNHPGLLIVRNPFTRAGQLLWVQRCLKEMPVAANKTNLASHGIQLQDRTWWQLCRTSEGKKSGLRNKLRWVTLGYHHDWDTKEYSENVRGDMPECVVRLCDVVVRVLGLSGSGDCGEFKAQAAIINYYHHHSTLGPHTDHSEPYMEVPLLSFSFGQSAVFLIGGQTKATAPTAILLHSGDIVIMGGAARLCYHAVPRILQREEVKKRCSKEEEKEDEKEEPWATEIIKKEIKEEKEQEKEELSSIEIINKEEGKHDTKPMKTENDEPVESKKRRMEGNQYHNPGTKTQQNEGSERQSQLNGNQNNNDTRLSRMCCEDDTSDDDLSDVLDYLRTSRINMNIRQVLPPSMDKLPS